MADKSAIEWTDASWNPVTGCTEVTPGCDNCYAKTFAERWRGIPGHYFEQGFDVVLRPERLDQPLKWTKPRRIFVNSMSDLFHDAVPDAFIGEVFARMGAASQHTFQLLTKRHGRMRSLLNRWSEHAANGCTCPDDAPCSVPVDVQYGTWPLPNVWLGVSVEDQKRANLRIPALLDTPAAIRWLSMEPLLGPVDLGQWLSPVDFPPCWDDHEPSASCGRCIQPDWVVVGGESGRGARPMHPHWARSLRDRCAAADVPFFFKQWGEWAPTSETISARDPKTMAMHPAGMVALTPDNPFNPFERGHPHWDALRRFGKKAAGRLLDDREWNEYPAAVPLAVR